MSKAKYLSKYCNEDEAYQSGLKEGTRCERRALRRIVSVAMREQNHEHCNECWYLGEIVLEKLSVRSKSKPTREGK